jgi:hypothetical protein
MQERTCFRISSGVIWMAFPQGMWVAIMSALLLNVQRRLRSREVGGALSHVDLSIG